MATMNLIIFLVYEKAFLYIHFHVCAPLKDGFPQYQAATEDVTSDYDFWKAHAITLPTWADAARKVLLVQPTFSAAEQVFSLMKNTVHLVINSITLLKTIWKLH